MNVNVCRKSPESTVSYWCVTAAQWGGHCQCYTQRDHSAYFDTHSSPCRSLVPPVSMSSVCFCCMTCWCCFPSVQLDCKMLLFCCFISFMCFYLFIFQHWTHMQYFSVTHFFYLISFHIWQLFCMGGTFVVVVVVWVSEALPHCGEPPRRANGILTRLFFSLSVPSAGMTRLARSRTTSSSSITSMDSSRSRNNLNSLLEGSATGALDSQVGPQTMEVSC